MDAEKSAKNAKALLSFIGVLIVLATIITLII